MLAQKDALERENAALREILQAVAPTHTVSRLLHCAVHTTLISCHLHVGAGALAGRKVHLFLIIPFKIEVTGEGVPESRIRVSM